MSSTKHCVKLYTYEAQESIINKIFTDNTGYYLLVLKEKNCSEMNGIMEASILVCEDTLQYMSLLLN